MKLPQQIAVFAERLSLANDDLAIMTCADERCGNASSHSNGDKDPFLSVCHKWNRIQYKPRIFLTTNTEKGFQDTQHHSSPSRVFGELYWVLYRETQPNHTDCVSPRLVSALYCNGDYEPVVWELPNDNSPVRSCRCYLFGLWKYNLRDVSPYLLRSSQRFSSVHKLLCRVLRRWDTLGFSVFHILTSSASSRCVLSYRKVHVYDSSVLRTRLCSIHRIECNPVSVKDAIPIRFFHSHKNKPKRSCACLVLSSLVSIQQVVRNVFRLSLLFPYYNYTRKQETCCG